MHVPSKYQHANTFYWYAIYQCFLVNYGDEWIYHRVDRKVVYGFRICDVCFPSKTQLGGCFELKHNVIMLVIETVNCRIEYISSTL